MENFGQPVFIGRVDGGVGMGWDGMGRMICEDKMRR